MLKRIAHNSTLHSTLPALSVGNKDLKPLQDLISLEKNVVISAQRLSSDITRAAEALKTWGLGEGEDLGDTLSASCSLLMLLANALSQYGHHENTIRDQMKSVRSREETLDDSKQRRKTVVAKAEASERKLSKMSPEHKNLQTQTEALNQLRDHIRQMDTDIMVEEAAISDFKRESTRTWMFLKFGSLQEFTEKGTIASEYGKLITANVPEDKTQPGFSRAMYQGHGKTQSLLQESTMAINDITLSSMPLSDHRPSAQFRTNANDTSPPGSGHMPDPNQGWPPPDGPQQQQVAHGHFMYPSETSATMFEPTPQKDPTLEAPHTIKHSVDDFGVHHSTPGSASAMGGRFATFPAQGPGGPRGVSLQDDSFSLNSRPNEPDDSFSSSIAAALRTSDEFARSDHPQYAPPPAPPPGAAPSMRPGHFPHNPTYQQPDSPDTGGGLAYMTEPTEEYHQGDRYVRFDPAPSGDYATEMQAPSSAPKEDDMLNPHPPVDPTDTYSGPNVSKRIPPPILESKEEVRTRDAEAAEEIRKEMDTLGTFSPPVGGENVTSIVEPQVSGGVDLAPPSAPFTHRNTSPQPMSHHGYDPDNTHTSPTLESPPSPLPPPGHHPGLSISSMERPELRSMLSSGSDATPSEYPRNMYASKSNISLGSTPPIGSSTGKISAAAFRRPQNRLGSTDLRGENTSPLTVKKKLPSSPYPEPQGVSSPGTEFGHTDPAASHGANDGDDDFDYIGAYVNETDDIPPATTSPPYADYGRLGKVVISNGAPAQSPSSSGFADRNFNDPGHLR